MGLDYSIRTYIREENISECLNWIKANTDTSRTSFSITINKQDYKLYGDDIHFYDSNLKHLDDSNFLNKEGAYEGFDTIYFSTSIMFDIDPQIISSVADWSLEFSGSRLEEFIENFQHHYLGNGKISIGNFDASITKLKNKPIYEIDFTAVTSQMSRMLESSHSVRKWLKELSKASDSILTYIDLEHNGNLITHYKGIDLEIHLKDKVDSSSYESLLDFFVDYYNLEFDCEFSTSLEHTTTSRIHIIEATHYKMFIENNQWIVRVSCGYHFEFKLNENQINKFRQEGKSYIDTMVEHKMSKK